MIYLEGFISEEFYDTASSKVNPHTNFFCKIDSPLFAPPGVRKIHFCPSSWWFLHSNWLFVGFLHSCWFLIGSPTINTVTYLPSPPRPPRKIIGQCMYIIKCIYSFSRLCVRSTRISDLLKLNQIK